MDDPYEPRFLEALRLHGNAAYAQAEKIYRENLAADPQHARAMHYLGVLMHQFDRSAEAEPLLRRSIQLKPDSAAFHNNLGNALRALNRPHEAVTSFVRAAELDPTSYTPPLNIAMLLASRQRSAEAIPWLRKTLELQPQQSEAMFLLGQALLTKAETTEEALMWIDRCLELEPDNERARFIRTAARPGANNPPPPMPPGFVQGIFDGYADEFDKHLVDDLQYRAPQLLRESVLRAVDADAARRFDILDLGCGTGLVGQAFRDIAKTLAGVDLSPNMIERARAKNVYDLLEVGDVLPALRRREGTLDLVLAGDVLVYIGGLSDVFTAVAAALRPAGIFAFTVEAHAGTGYHLNIARRYEHSHAYVRDVAAANRFTVEIVEDVVVRREAQKDVASTLYLLRRT